MKKLFILFGIAVFSLSITTSIFAQTEIKGSGNTAATNTLEIKNSTPVTNMVVRDDGNVGIGTTNPSQKLEVNGWVFVSGAGNGIQFDDGSTQTTAATGGSVAYQNVITVAQSGGDFNTINGALAFLPPTPPPYGPGSAWHIRVMPGIYTETINVPKYVHLKGAGKHTTFIQGTVTMADTCLIEDFHIEGSILCPGTSPTIIHNIITSGADQNNGIHVSAGGDPWIKENEIIDCGSIGIYVQGFGTEPWIIANKIMRNSEGIRCEDSSPTISNNFIFGNMVNGIYLAGAIGTPAEPTIDDNVIGSTAQQMGGNGIFMEDYAEPRIIANDIYICEYGIRIETEFPQPSIIGNNINYNYDNGIYCEATGASKPVVIKSNHIHSNGDQQSPNPAGIYLATTSQNPIGVIITHNNIHNNRNTTTNPGGWDIDYLSSVFFPMISLNVFDWVTPGGAAGQLNVTTTGLTIAP